MIHGDHTALKNRIRLAKVSSRDLSMVVCASPGKIRAMLNGYVPMTPENEKAIMRYLSKIETLKGVKS